MKHPGRWLTASTALLLLTPFAIFPEIIGDLGPQHVQLWRNILGAVLLGLAWGGIVVSLAAMVKRRMLERRMKPADGQHIQFQ
jgi:hypothetical protein